MVKPRMNLFPAIADKLEREPRLLEQGLATAERWILEKRGPAERLEWWRDTLRSAMASGESFSRLLTLLRDDSEAALRIKDFAPLPGLLTREERRKVFLTCSYDH